MERTVVYTAEQIKEILPHRYPFLFLDKVIEVTEGSDAGSRVGRRAKAIKNVSVNEHFFEGHFPKQPVMPGVLLVEAMAQAGAIACFKYGDRPQKIMITNIKDARFRRPVVPGDTIVLSGHVVKERGSMVVIDCDAVVDGQVVAEAQIMAYVTLEDGPLS